MKKSGCRVFVLGCVAAMGAGCSSFSGTPSIVNDPCTALSDVIADYPSGFESIRGSRSDFSSMSLYRAKKDLIKGHCEIWEWAAGETAYVCSVNAPNQQIAEHRYEKAVDDISGCLGSSWAGEESERVRDGSPAGVVTRFRNSDQTGLVISIHNVAIAGGKGSARSNYLFIGGVGKANEL